MTRISAKKTTRTSKASAAKARTKTTKQASAAANTNAAASSNAAAAGPKTAAPKTAATKSAAAKSANGSKRTPATSARRKAAAKSVPVAKTARANAAKTSTRKAAVPKAAAGKSVATAAVKTSRKSAASAPTAPKRQVRSALPPVVPIRDRHSILDGAILVRPSGTDVVFTNVSTKKNVTVSRNIASTVERALNILVPTEGGRETTTASSASVTTGARELADMLMSRGVVEADDVTLTPRRASVDSKHPDQIVEDGKGLPIVVFDIRIKNEEDVIGHLFALAAKKFTFVAEAGDLQSQKSNHLNVDHALVRIQVAAAEYLARRANQNQAPASAPASASAA